MSNLDGIKIAISIFTMKGDGFDFYNDSFYNNGYFDRRKKTLINRLRRQLNSYWLVPVFIIYLELLATIFPPFTSPIKNLKERNLNFLRGPGVFYHLLTTDFPYGLIGHFKEIIIIKKYTFNIGQASSVDMSNALEDKDTVRKIYRRVVQSRGFDNTEIGGIATMEYTPEGPKLHLYEIPSRNKVFSDRLHRFENTSVEKFLSFIQEGESREVIINVGIDNPMIDNMIKVLLSAKPDNDRKHDLIKNFMSNYDIHSESKYILSPYDFKAVLGSPELSGKYVGIFHFHNSYMEPPSDIDVENSSTDRQLVITLGDRGIVIYDIIKGKEVIYKGDLISL